MIDVEKIKRKLALSAIKGEFTVGITSKNAADLYNQIIQSKRSNKKFNNDLLSEIPFEIPINWIWCNLCNIASIVVGATPSTANRDYWGNGDIYWIPSGCCHDCVVTKESHGIKTITQKGYDNCSTTLMQPNTTLIALTGATAGRIGYLTFEACANQSVVGILADKLINPRYVYYSFFARKNEILGDCVGSAQPHFSKNYVTKMIFPLPPVEIQNAIVAKLDDIFAELDKINSDHNKLVSLQAKLEDKLLQLAIQGKLVEQRPEEGTGEELFEKNCNKVIDNINYSKVPFDIPNNWKWIRLGWVMEIERGGSPRPIKSFITDDINGINWIKIGDVDKGGKYVFSTKQKIRPEGEAKSRRVFPGDFLLTNSMSFGRPYISKITGCIHDGWLLLRNSFKVFDLDYLYLLLSSSYVYEQFSKKASGATVDNLNKDKVSALLVPLPPLEEQKRIVAKLNELLPQVNHFNRD